MLALITATDAVTAVAKLSLEKVLLGSMTTRSSLLSNTLVLKAFKL